MKLPGIALPRPGPWVERPVLSGTRALHAGFVAAALVLGLLVGVRPELAVAVVGGAGILALAWFAPVTHFTVLLVLTSLVPYGLQNLASVGPGLIPSDVLLLSGLVVTAIRLPRTPVTLRGLTAAGILVVFTIVAVIAAYHGLSANGAVSQVGFELRILLGFSTLLIAMPLLAAPESRRRLLTALLVAGLLLGLWGMAQWFLNIPEINESGIGVRSGVTGTSAGRGQLQGGLYSFPIAVALSFAVLLSGGLRTQRARVLVLAVLALNLVSLMLTFERTFWATTILGMGFIVANAGRGRRFRAAVALGIVGLALLSVFATLAPGELTTARERITSAGQYGGGNTIRIRLRETDHAMREVDKHPWSGSGLGSTIWIGQPWLGVPPVSEWYIHNGYVWLVWRLGLIGSGLLFALLIWAITARAGPSGDRRFDGVRTGARAGLLVLMLSSVTFPAFNALEATITMGLLAAIALVPSAQGLRPSSPPDRPGSAARPIA